MKKRDNFVLFTSVLAGLLTLLYVFKGIEEGFNVITIIIIACNVSYIPGVLIFGRKFFIWWSIPYCVIQVSLIAKQPSKLFNNYTALFIVFVASLIKPDCKRSFTIIYAVAVTIAFLLNDEPIYHYLIHIARSFWIMYILNYFLKSKFERRPLDLTEDEVKILEELDEKKLLKAVTCFSKNTVTQKLKDARERNKIDTNAELLAEFKMSKK